MIYFLFTAITLIGLVIIPKKLRIWDPIDIDDENSQLLKQMGGFKKRRAQQQQNKLK